MNKLLHLCFAILKRGTPFVLSLPSSSWRPLRHLQGWM